MTALARRAVLIGAAAAVVAGQQPASASAASANRLVVIGDSWTAGLYADPAHALGQVAASAIGWRVRVDGVSGSGYLNAIGRDAAYPARAGRAAAEPGDRIVVVQGGGNDWYLDLRPFPAAALATIDRLRARYPRAGLLILGPSPDPWPVTAKQRRVDDLLAAASRRRGVPYVSMFDERWITASNLDRVIDRHNKHPTAAGHRYLGRRLAQSIVQHFPAAAHLR